MPMVIDEGQVLTAESLDLIRKLDKPGSLSVQDVLPGDVLRFHFKGKTKLPKGIEDGNHVLIYDIMKAEDKVFCFYGSPHAELSGALNKFLEEILRTEITLTFLNRYRMIIGERFSIFFSEIEKIDLIGSLRCFDNLQYDGKHIGSLKNNRPTSTDSPELIL